MCGISGYISETRTRGADSLHRMHEALRHRGPDGEGVFADPRVMLASRRLGIIDLAGGGQPLFNEDRSLVLIANGEIYNHVELRGQLEAGGHRFVTGSDCETILHLYEERGSDCVQSLRGMFAFALWDSRRRRLILARDRMGEKPLYLYEQPGRLTFASELKALLRTGVAPMELDPTAVDLYFHYGYVPEPWTPIRGIRKLPAAHVLTVDLDPWRIERSCYWRMEDAPPLQGDPAEVIRNELETIGGLVTRSDVPVGVALSGGLDSTAIAALTCRAQSSPLQALCVGYPGRPAYDERAAARRVADSLGMPFHDVEISPNDVVGFFPELVRHTDDPIADIAGFAYYALMRRARECGIGVMLLGHGGDELFGGYPWVDRADQESRRKQTCDPDQRAAPADRMIFYDLVPDFETARAELPAYYTAAFRQRLTELDPCDLFTFPHPWPRVDLRITRLICDLYLRENGIAQGDRLAMASSVELRLPLVDHRLVETVIGLRKARPHVRVEPKAWLKAAVRDIVPDWVLARSKQGFSPPLRTWHRAYFDRWGAALREGHLVGFGVLTSKGAENLASGPAPKHAVASLSYKALVLETWCREMSPNRADGVVQANPSQDLAAATCM